MFSGSTRPISKALGVLTVAVLAWPVMSGPAQAEDQNRKTAEHGTKTVSYDLDDYGVVSMSDAVRRISRDLGGQVVDIRLETPRDINQWTYSSKVLLPDGRVVYSVHDPKTLDVLSQDTQF